MKRFAALILACGFMAGFAGQAAAADPVVPEFKRGINLSRVFGFPLRVGSTNTYPAAPFAGQLSLTMVKDADLAKLSAMGFDFVRLPVDPGPFIVATGTQKTALLKQLNDFIVRLHAAKLKVLVDIHPSTYQSDWKPADILTDTTLPKYQTYSEFLVQVARLLNDKPYDKIALEIMNEPQGPCKRSDGGPEWTYTQRRLWNKIRVATPKLPLVVTGPCWSSVDGVVMLDPTYFDAATLYDIHFYDPHEFTHQSLTWSSNPINLTSGLSYPYNSGTVAKTALASLTYQAAQTPKLTPTASLQSDLNTFLNRYYTVTKPDKNLIAKRFGLVTTWATKYKVPANRIVIGEFGAVRWLPAIEDGSRGRWLADVKSVAEASGFGWAVWDYDKVFGIILDYPTQTLDMAVVNALGLTVPAK